MNPPQKNPKAVARQAQIDESAAGQRLDNYLLGALKGVPRSHIYRLIRSGQVRVNSGRVNPKHRLKAGDRVRVPPVAIRPPAPAASTGSSLDWLAQRIVFEDQRLLVLDKPAGLAVHGGTGVALGCIEALRALRPEIKELELVHPSPAECDRLTEHSVPHAKRVRHRVARDRLRVVHAKRLARRRDGAFRGAGESRVRVARGGKAARSSFRLLETIGPTASLLEVSIATGRTHQIRVHAAHLGHPVAGDERYGDPEFNAAMRRLGLRRMFLHSRSVAFVWPESGEEFSIDVPLPQELEDVLTTVRGRAPTDRAPRP